MKFAFNGTTIKVEDQGGKALTIFPPALDLGLQQVTAVFTPTTRTSRPAPPPGPSGSCATNATEATARYRGSRDRLVARALVVAEHSARR